MPSAGGAALDKVRKAARQLAYDTKYKVKKSMGANVSKMAPAAVTKAYLAQLAKSPAPGPVKSMAQKILTGGVKEEHDIDSLASNTVANAMFKVFVEGIQEEPELESGIELSYLNQLIEDTDTKKYKVVVTDKKTGNQYRRLATREKIAELRANPNIQSVEISSYGEPIGSEKKSGEQTAKVKSGKGLDPVGKEDSDVNNDGKVDKTDKYLQNRRDVRGAAISSRKKGLGESVEAPVMDAAPAKRPTKDQNDAEIVSNEEKGVDNRSLIKVFPELKLRESTYSKFLEMIQEKTLTAAETKKKEEIVKSMKKNASDFEKRYPGRGKEVMYATATKQAKKVAEEAECDSEKKDGEDDPRSMKTKVNLVKNKLRSMGLKMSYEPEGEMVDEGWPFGPDTTKPQNSPTGTKSVEVNKPYAARQNNQPVDVTYNKKGEKKVAPMPAGRAGLMNYKHGSTWGMNINQSYELEGEIIDERRKEDKVAGTPRKPRDKAFELVAKSMGTGRMGVKPRGEKKEPGKKPPAAGEYGGPKSPAQKVDARRAAAQKAQDMMHSRYD